MTIEMFITMTIAVLIMAAVPGPVMLATMARSVAGGMRSAKPFLLGVAVADIIYAGLAMAGLAWIAAAYGPVFEVIKWVGAGYLIWLGIGLLRSAGKADNEETTTHPIKQEPFWLGWLSGLVITLGNPKLILFYVSFLPTFMDMDALSAVEATFAVSWIAVVFLAANTGWALSVSPLGTWLRQGRKSKASGTGRALRTAGGFTLIGSGVWLVSK